MSTHQIPTFTAPTAWQPPAAEPAQPTPPTPGHWPGTQFASSPRRRSAPGWGKGLVSTALAAVIGAGAGVGGYAYLDHQTAPAASIAAVPVTQPKTLDGTVSAAAQAISPSVVTITVQGRSGASIGSGIVLDATGNILTNDHVVAESGAGATITVTFDDDSTATATVVGTSPTDDLAVIRVSHPTTTLHPATFAPSSSVAVGMSVVAVGAPLGLTETVTSGIVSATSRPVRSGTSGNAVYEAVQTDAAINPGNSGGPLVNLNGEIIGINSAGASVSESSTGQSGSIGLGFAIPSDVAVRVANQLISTGRATHATLGVSLQSGDSTLPTSAGVVINSLADGGAAASAGLRAGDVVTALGDIATPTADALIAATRFHAPGSTVTVQYTRDGQASEAQVTLGSASGS